MPTASRAAFYCCRLPFPTIILGRPPGAAADDFAAPFHLLWAEVGVKAARNSGRQTAAPRYLLPPTHWPDCVEELC